MNKQEAIKIEPERHRLTEQLKKVTYGRGSISAYINENTVVLWVLFSDKWNKSQYTKVGYGSAIRIINKIDKFIRDGAKISIEGNANSNDTKEWDYGFTASELSKDIEMNKKLARLYDEYSTTKWSKINPLTKIEKLAELDIEIKAIELRMGL
jgi:hypothetical protein